LVCLWKNYWGVRGGGGKGKFTHLKPKSLRGGAWGLDKKGEKWYLRSKKQK